MTEDRSTGVDVSEQMCRGPDPRGTVLEEAFARDHALLYRAAVRLMGSREEAQDVVSEALLRAYTKLDTLAEDRAAGGWLYRIVVNTALMRLRTRRRGRDESLDALGPRFSADGRYAQPLVRLPDFPAEAALRADAVERMCTAVHDLPDRARTAYVLVEWEGLSYEEAAEHLGSTPNAVKVAVHRARLPLRDRLADYFSGEER